MPVVTNFFTKLIETYRPSPRHLVNSRRVDLHSRGGGGVYSLQTMRLCLKGLPFSGVRIMKLCISLFVVDKRVEKSAILAYRKAQNS